jgi:hypothetical protein
MAVMQMRSKLAQARLKEIDTEYRKAHGRANAAFRKVFDELLIKHGGEFKSLIDFHSLPAVFHEELAPHKEAHVAAIRTADNERGRNAAKLPTRVVRINRSVG